MINIKFNLPRSLSLTLKISKRRKSDMDKSSLPLLEQVKRTKKGSHFSRLFRLIFSHKNLKKIFGANIAFALIFSSFLPTQGNFLAEAEDNIVKEELVLTTQKGVRYPTEEVKINQGYRIYHPGIDLDGNIGDPVYPVMAGVVSEISRSKYAYGNAVIVDHGNNITSLYGHLSKISVEKDDVLTTKSVLGEVGSTGHSTGPHLHLEIRSGGIPVNPFSILPR